MGSPVDINSCTDACTHSNQGMCPEVGWLWQPHNAPQGHPCFHQTMHGGGGNKGSQVDINSCTDAFTHSNQGVWPQPIGGGSSNWMWDLWLEVGASLGAPTPNQSWDLQLEMGAPVGAPTSNQRSHLQLELPPLIKGLAFSWSSHLWWVEQTLGVRWICIHVLMHVHILTKVWKQKWGHWDTTTVPQGAPRLWYNYLKGVKQTLSVRWTCIHVLIHVHILIMVWDHKQGDWDKHTLLHRGTQISI